jgi:type VI protein secretion system component VasF
MAQTTDPTSPPSGAPDPAAGPAADVQETETLPQMQAGTVISPKRAPKRSAKRTRVVVRKVGPWSVFKLSLIFYFVVMLIGWGALLIVYSILGASGAIKSITDLSAQIGLWDKAKAQPTIDGRQIFTWLFVAGLVAVVIWSLINFLVALAYNLVSDVVGGLELTLAESKHRDDV